MKNIKKDLINALKYVCPKFGYSFLCLGVALVLVLPAKMADILFESPGNILFTLAIACPSIWILRDLMGESRMKAMIERFRGRVSALEEEKKVLEAENKKLKAQNQNLLNIIANGGNTLPKENSPAKVVFPSEDSSTKKPFDFDAEYEDKSMEEEPVEDTGDEPAEEIADDQIPEPAEEKKDLQESSES